MVRAICLRCDTFTDTASGTPAPCEVCLLEISFKLALFPTREVRDRAWGRYVEPEGDSL